jgi:curved DNA-binding protein CbpA
MINGIRDYYSILGLTPHASEEEIHKTYIKLAKIYHPDHNVDPEDRRMIELNQIYEVLSNPAKRQEYDARFKPSQTFDFTNAHKKDVANKNKERVVKPKGQATKRLKLLLLILLWAIIGYVALYFIVNILVMYANLPGWLTGLFPQ